MLSDSDILKAMKAGLIVIDPFERRQLGTNSYDVRLGEWYFSPSGRESRLDALARSRFDWDNRHGTDDPYAWGGRSIDFWNEEEARAYWGEAQRARDGKVHIPPGETILAHTIEVIGGRYVPAKGIAITTSMRARSSIGRSGLSVCKCAGVGDVGFISRWTMEISNHTQMPIALPVGARVAQIEFHRVDAPTQEYQGKYGQQREWTPDDMLPKLWLDWDHNKE